MGGTKMAVMVAHWERRDTADLEDLANAALAYCRAARARNGVSSSRFFWMSPDQIVIQTEADTPQAFNELLDADTGKTFYALSELARSAAVERWMEPRTAEAAYRAMGK
jgi:hypothetical protein